MQVRKAEGPPDTARVARVVAHMALWVPAIPREAMEPRRGQGDLPVCQSGGWHTGAGTGDPSQDRRKLTGQGSPSAFSHGS